MNPGAQVIFLGVDVKNPSAFYCPRVGNVSIGDADACWKRTSELERLSATDWAWPFLPLELGSGF